MPQNPITRLAARLTTVALAVLFFLPSHGHAQTTTLSWTETSSLEVPGTLGMMLRAMPGALDSRSSQQSLHFQGGTLIQEDGRTATIMDAEEGRFITIDHEARTYMTFTFADAAQATRQMNERMSEAMSEVEQAMEEDREEREAAMAELRQAMEEAREALDFSINVDRTGQTRSFGAAGTAAQHMITAELTAAAPPDGVEDAETGSLVFIMELWQSPDLPTPDAFYQEWGAALAADPEMQALANELAASAEEVGDASTAALAMWDPRFAAGLAEIAEAAQRIDGTTVQSVVTVALVPDGQELDRDELLAWEPESAGDRLRAEGGEAARDAVRGAARRALGGLFGGGGDDEEETDEVKEVRPLFRLTTTKEDIVHGETGDDVLAALRQRMEGYREVTMAELMEEAQGQGR